MNNYSCLPTNFFRYAFALIKQNEYLNKFRLEVCTEESTEQLNKPLFNPNRHPKFSPDLSEEEVKLLKDSVHFNREDLLEILNILILNYINLEDILDDQLDRHGTDNARISDSEV